MKKFDPRVVKRVQKLRKAGLTYEEIAERVGVSNTTACRWCNPEYNKNAQRRTREWRAKNREYLKKASRRYHLSKSKPCKTCKGRVNGVSTTGICQKCRYKEAAARRRKLIQLYKQGKPLKEIAKALNTTVNTVSVEVVRARRAGYDLPRRHQRVEE